MIYIKDNYVSSTHMPKTLKSEPFGFKIPKSRHFNKNIVNAQS